MTAIKQIDLTDLSQRVVLHAGHEPLVVPGGNALLTAHFERLGDDLLAHGPHGFDVVVHDYFAAGHHPDLLTASGARLESDLVATLSRPQGYLQLADDQGTQTDTTGAGAHPIGKVDGLSGAVDVQHANGTTEHLAQGSPVFQGDVIESGADGQVAITFVDGTAFSLGAGARMTLDELVYNPAGKDNSFTASVLQGSFAFMTGGVAPSGNMAVKTPVGTIGIRGTTVVGHLTVEGSDSTFVLVPDPKTGHVGKVIFTNGGGTQTLDAANASTTVVSFFISPTEPVILPASQVLQMYDQILQEFYDQHGGAPAQHDDPGKQGSNEHEGNQAATDDLANFNTAAGPGANPLGGGTDPLANTLGAIPPLPINVTFTGLGITGVITFDDNGDAGGGGYGVPRDNQNPGGGTSGGVHTIPGQGFTTIIGTPEGDNLDQDKNTGALHIFGEDGNDVITGGSANDEIHGGPGDDTLMGAAGNDKVFGEGGNDLIIGGSGLGNDHYDGGDGNDTVEYASATKTIIVNLTTGTASGDPEIGHDTLVNIENVLGGAGNDVIIGNAQDNILNGGTGDDQLAGQGGNDTLIGGGGNDVAVFSGKLADYTVVYDGESGTYTVTDSVAGRDGTDTLRDITQARFSDGVHNLADLLSPPSAPTDANDSLNQVNENAANGTLVGITASSLAFNGHDVVYSLLDDDGGRFTINAETGVVSVADGSKLDYESQVAHKITVQASDGIHTSSTVFDITLQDVNESPSAPVDIDGNANAVREHAATGTEVGIIAQSTDPDTGNSVTYSLSNNAGGLFAIDEQGHVTVASSEGLGKGTYTITVDASDGTLHSSSDMTITVGDDSAPSVPVDVDNNANSVAQHAAAGTVIGITAQSTDADAGDHLTYSLVQGPGNLFAIDPDTGVVTVANKDTLVEGSYKVTVVASDGTLSSTKDFTINVTDQAPSAPVDVNAADNTVLKHAANGTEVGITVQSTDPEPGDHVSYTLTSNPNGLFAIDAEGHVTVAKGASLETGSYTITVQASDGSKSSTSDFTINVTDRAPSAPVDANASANSIREHASNGALVGITAASSDPDAGDTVSYSLTGNPNNLFAIDAQGHVTVANGAALGKGSYTITVQATDGVLTSQQDFTITVGDDTAPTKPVDTDGTANAIQEHSAIGTVVGVTMQSSDIDSGDKVTYSLIQGPGGLFAIDPNTGVISVGNSGTLTAGSYTVTVVASDGTLSSQSNVTIEVTVASKETSSGDVTQGDPLIIGNTGKAALELLAGGTINAHTIIVGKASTGDGVFSLDPGSTAGFADLGTVTIGEKGTGQLSITGTLAAPSELIANWVSFGEEKGGTGTGTVSGAGASIVTSGDNNAVFVGNAGTGTLTIENGAQAKTLDLEIGSRGTGTMTLTGAGSTVTVSNDTGSFGDPDPDEAGLARVGTLNGSNGTLKVLNGAHLEIRAGMDSGADKTAPVLVIGDDVGSKGTVLLDGLGSSIAVSMTAAADPAGTIDTLNGPAIIVGSMGQGQMTVSNHATASMTGDEAYLDVGVGDWHNPEDTTALPQSLLQVTSGGQINITDHAGGDGGLIIGDYLDGNGKVVIDGAGSAINVDSQGGARVGRAGTGELVVQNGGSLVVTSDSYDNLNIGQDAGSHGTVTVTGAGSSIVTKGDNNAVQVGAAGTGSLTVANGGLVSTLDFEIGSIGSGTATITGAGSKVIASNDGGLFGGEGAGEAGYVRVGNEAGSQGSLTISNGGSLEIRAGQTVNTGTTAAELDIAEQQGSTGTVTVTGAGSKIDVAGPDAGILVGVLGAGTMILTDHATVTVHGSDAFVDVGLANALDTGDGDDSQGDEDQGNGDSQAGLSSLTISGGASLTVIGTAGHESYFSIGEQSNGNGAVLVGAGGSLTVDGGNLSVGHEGVGVLTISTTGSNVATTAIVTAHTAEIGDKAGSTGAVFVEGVGAELITTGADNGLEVGRDGGGVLQVLEGGTVETLWLELGRSAESIGAVTVSGAGSKVIVSTDNGGNSDPYLQEAGAVVVGRDGSGLLQITDGGVMEIRGSGTTDEVHVDPYLYVGRDEGGTGVVTIDGVGSKLSVYQAPGASSDVDDDGPYVLIGREGQGEMAVSNHGQLSLEGENAHLVVSNGNWDSDGETLPQSKLTVTNGGQVTLTDNTDNTTPNFYPGGFDIGVGKNANGLVTVSSDLRGATSSITVQSNYGMTIARQGIGELDIGNGGTVSIKSRAGAAVQSGLTMADQASGRATLSLNGTTAQLQITSPNTGIGLMSGAFILMSAGESSFTVSNHAAALVQGEGAHIVIGDQSTAQASMTVESGGGVTVDGLDGAATVIVANQGGSEASLTVTGDGSHFDVNSKTGQMLIGAYMDDNHVVHTDIGGNGSVKVEDGATLSVGNTDTHGTGDAEIVIGSHGSLDIDSSTVSGDVTNAGGHITIGDGEIAHSNIDGNLNFTEVASKLTVDAVIGDGITADSLDVSHNVTLTAGTVEFNPLSGNFAQNDTFDFLTAGGKLTANLSDISLVAHNVDTNFRFELQQIDQTLQFHALNTDHGGTSDVFLGGNKDDTYTGTGDNNYLSGGGGNDILKGGDTGNTILGGAGTDTMTGGKGADTFSFANPTDGVHVSNNVTVTDSHAAIDQITNFDAAIDKLSFVASGFGVAAINSSNFSKIDGEYDGTNGVTSVGGAETAYGKGEASFILDGNNNLIYDSNGKGEGYTIVAHINTTSSTPAITAEHNLQVA